jgi:type I restriction enzyme R subunit
VLCALLYPVGYRQGELDQALDPERLFSDSYDHILVGEERTREFLDAQKTLGSFYALVSTQPAVIPLREKIRFFKKLAAAVRAITTPDTQVSPQAEQAIRQFMSEGPAAGDIVETLQIAEQDRPDISVLSDEFLDSLAAKTEHPNVQIRLLEKPLKGEIKSSTRTNQTQAKIFGEPIEAVLARYEQRQITSVEVVQRLAEIAKSLRDARGRHEQLGLTPDEAAFYDAMAGGVQDAATDPQVAVIARDLAKSIRADLTVDWADRESSEAAIRRKIRRLLRQHHYQPATATAVGGGEEPYDVNHYTQLVLEQAKALYRYWPDVEGRLLE